MTVTVTGLSKDRMLQIEAASITGGVVNGLGHLILTRHDGTPIDAGSVIGPQGPPYVNGVDTNTAQTITGNKKFTGHVDIDLFGNGKNLNFRPDIDVTGASMGVQAKDFSGDNNHDGIQINGYDGVAIGTKQGKMFQVRRDGGVDIDLFGAVAGNRFVNFRPALNDAGANIGIQAVDWSGDTNFDGLKINGADGIGFGTADGTMVKFDRDGRVKIERAIPGLSLWISKESATMGNGSIVIQRSSGAANQSLVFSGGYATNFIIGRDTTSDDLALGYDGGGGFVKTMRITGGGALFTSGSELRVGGGGLGGSGVYVRLADDFAHATMNAGGTPADIQFDISSKGAGVITFNIGGIQGGYFANAGADLDTWLVLRRTVAGVQGMYRVAVGPVDSGGAGYRALRIGN